MLGERPVKSSPRSVFPEALEARDSEITRIIIDFFPCAAEVNRFKTRKSDDD
jgi:hypothetical protein